MKNQNAKSPFLNGKKLIVLAIVLLTTLSATLIGNLSETTKKQGAMEVEFKSEFEKDLELTKKLKLFNAKDYLKDYEHRKQTKKMLDESTGRFELSFEKHIRPKF